ncbi:TIGR02301 family protein [Aquisalinus flavus]|uniref:TIGR02301 family protein n=1 Tax=Aquisalinus flavus TaxID=1526572 RepID=A0A8J2V4E3_9PROT|nr:TIGR02301 family protein [Aquisalinus flavus]MBD0426522.1 TIGR02301 family protein [Aquisalinus flavus]GGD07294.1 hypothetical protein GCM10011342_15120 [Aquisalinus flavus]
MRKSAFIAAALIAALPLSALPLSATAQGATASAWQQRSTDLVTMSRLLGNLHHYHQLCYPGDWRPDLYRDRMKEMVSLEDPYETLKDDMIDGFNEAYRATSDSYAQCTAAAIEAMRQTASSGDVVAGRLAAPYREVSGYDYDATGD